MKVRGECAVHRMDMRQGLMVLGVALARWMAEIMVSGMPLFLLACQVSFFIPQKSVKNHFLCRRIIEQLRRKAPAFAAGAVLITSHVHY